MLKKEQLLFDFNQKQTAFCVLYINGSLHYFNENENESIELVYTDRIKDLSVNKVGLCIATIDNLAILVGTKGIFVFDESAQYTELEDVKKRLGAYKRDVDLKAMIDDIDSIYENYSSLATNKQTTEKFDEKIKNELLTIYRKEDCEEALLRLLYMHLFKGLSDRKGEIKKEITEKFNEDTKPLYYITHRADLVEYEDENTVSNALDSFFKMYS